MRELVDSMKGCEKKAKSENNLGILMLAFSLFFCLISFFRLDVFIFFGIMFCLIWFVHCNIEKRYWDMKCFILRREKK